MKRSPGLHLAEGRRGSILWHGLSPLFACVICYNSSLAQPRAQQEFRIHHAGDFLLGTTNHGWITTGHGDNDYNPKSKDKTELQINWYPSLEFPKFGRIGYLGLSSIICGGIVRQDTLVSSNYPLGGSFAEFTSFDTIRLISSNPASPYFHVTAKSEQQFEAVYNDTTILSYAASFQDFDDRRPHKPLGIEVHQTSHANSAGGLSKCVIFDLWFVNVGNSPIHGFAAGVIWRTSIFFDHFESEYGLTAPSDDICGWLDSSQVLEYKEPIDAAWFADNDGDPLGGTFVRGSPRAVVGLKLLRCPEGSSPTFNWWSWAGPPGSLDEWGPSLRRHSGSYSNYPGTPYGDRSVYAVMRNGEIDYSLPSSGLSHPEQDWVQQQYPLDTRVDRADGGLVTMLVNFSPSETALLPGDSLPLTFAVAVGDDFHTDPTNFRNNFGYWNPSSYLDRLNFGNLVRNLRTAGHFFDNPGVDSDLDGFRGDYRIVCEGGSCDTTWITGDGVPDWRGAGPPPLPKLEVSSQPFLVKVRWTGAVSEIVRDQFSNRRDFEGYRAYISRTNDPREFSLLSSWDIPDNYYRLAYDPVTSKWNQMSYPLVIEQWRELLGDPEFDPRDYDGPSLSHGYRDTFEDTVRDASGTIIRIVTRERVSYWAAQGPNMGNTYQDGGVTRQNLIQQVEVRDTIIGEDTLQYGTYEMTIDNLSAAIPLWFSITAFDHGDYNRGVATQEGNVGTNAQFAFPVHSADVVEDSGLAVTVYPNPYKISFADAHGNQTNYFAQGYEAYGRAAMDERERRIWFANLPDTARIAIYSLDGDLIREIWHPDKYLTRYSSIVGWDLISRNTQAVTSGIYIWKVDSKLGSQVGKVVIIK